MGLLLRALISSSADKLATNAYTVQRRSALVDIEYGDHDARDLGLE